MTTNSLVKLKNTPSYLLRLVPALLFLTVFIRMDGVINPWSLSKALYIICLVSVMCLLLAASLLVQQKKVRLDLNIVDGFVFLLTVYILVRGYFTKHFLPGNYYFILVIAMSGIYFLFKILLCREFKNQCRTFIYILAGGLLVTGLIQAIIGLLQLYGVFPSNNRFFTITGSFGNPDFLAGYLAIIMTIAAGVVLYSGRKRIPQIFKYLSAVTFFAGLLALLPTYDRAAWLAAATGIGFVAGRRYGWWMRLSTIFNTFVKKVTAVFMILCLLVALGTGLFILNPDSAYGRLLIWKITATRLVPHHLVFGVGFNRFKADYDNIQAAYFASGAGSKKEKWVAGNVHRAHNEYLQILAELGIIGLLLFSGLMVALFWKFKENKSDSRRSNNAWLHDTLTASLIAAAVLAFFSFPFHIISTAAGIVFLGACCSALKPSNFQTLISFDKKSLRVGFPTILLLAAVAGFYYSIHTFHQYSRWEEAVQLTFTGQPRQTEALFKQLYPALKNDGRFLFMWGSYRVRSGHCHEALPLLEKAEEDYTGPHLYLLSGTCYQKLGEFRKAETSIKHAMWMRPAHLYPRYLLARLYQQWGRTDQAVHTARVVLNMKGKRQTKAGRQIKKKMQALIGITKLNDKG